MKRKIDRFKEIKVQMVMKLKKLSRAAAMEEIARIEAARKKPMPEGTAEAREGVSRKIGPNIAVDEEMLSAEEFFGMD